ncbi:MAG: glycine cleavage system protein GcvH [Nitrososphaerota archaeon]|jgi:glycine cleavage system H protein|nr:glycine cleavage system protein GcvH [Nitrososphaerota archaeon]MDG6942963.1 glycine cleavage system protein GcvH [Nitrososphaerota archaeon]MDG6950691.1 glycine cleavage system protein GcvH [Nitrososphaerota archaeon]
MEIHGYRIPDDLMYTKEHEWAKDEGRVVRIGITDYAAKTLNDVVYVSAPKAKGAVEQGKPMGTVESIKAVSEVYAPISGKVVKVNIALESHPELINKSPYGEGWLVEVEPSNLTTERRSLFDAKGYAAYLETTFEK